MNYLPYVVIMSSELATVRMKLDISVLTSIDLSALLVNFL